MVSRSGEVRSLHTLEHVLGADPAVVRGFARAAADHLVNGPLTLDARDRLLGRGERLGLRRFDANLVLAAVEQRHRQSAGPRAIGPVGATVAAPLAARAPLASMPSTWTTAAAAVVLQGVILTGAWWLLA